jgi:hypothetical protein
MRFFLSAALAASMWVPAASACRFDAFSLDQVRTLELTFDLYVDRVVERQIVHHQGFNVNYDAQIFTRDNPTLDKLTIRPQVTHPDEMTYTLGDGVEIRLYAYIPDLPPWLPSLPPPEDSDIQTSAYIVGNAGSYNGHVVTRFLVGHPEEATLSQTADGWIASVTGPTKTLDPTNPRDVNVAVYDFNANGHRYDMILVEYGWTEATIPLTAPDCLCSGDHNADGSVDQADMDLVLLNWGMLPPAEWTHDPPEFVRQRSLDAVLIAWGDVSPPKLIGGAAVPEPATVVLILVAALCVRRRR